VWVPRRVFSRRRNGGEVFSPGFTGGYFERRKRGEIYGECSNKGAELVRQDMRLAGDAVSAVEVWVFVSEDLFGRGGIHDC